MKNPQDKINHFIAEWREKFSPSSMKTMVNGVEVTGIYTGKVPRKIESAMMAIEKLSYALDQIGDFNTLEGEKYLSYADGWFGVAEFARNKMKEVAEILEKGHGE